MKMILGLEFEICHQPWKMVGSGRHCCHRLYQNELSSVDADKTLRNRYNKFFAGGGGGGWSEPLSWLWTDTSEFSSLLIFRTKWCELREYKINEYVTIAVNRNLSNCEIARKKVFRGFNGIRTRGLCVSAAVLYQPELWRPTHREPANLLIYEFINPWKEWNTERNDVNCGNLVVLSCGNEAK